MSRASTAAHLRGELRDLSSAIEIQIQVLRDLRKQQSDVRKRLNAVLDPMALLPLELQSEIFVRCVSDDLDCIMDPKNFPLAFLLVSRLWRDIALSTPRLWTRLRINVFRNSNIASAELVPSWIKLAGNLPMSLTLSGWLQDSQNFSALLEGCGPHLHELFIQPLVGQEGSMTRQIHLSGAAFPSLHTLVIHSTSHMAATYNVTDWLDVLHAAPLLAECYLRGIRYGESEYLRAEAPMHLTHASLRKLHFGLAQNSRRVNYAERNSAILLQHLTLPSLEDLLLSFLEIPLTIVTSFLTRSAAPIRVLEMKMDLRWPPESVIEFINFTPDLTHLTVVEEGYSSVLEAIATQDDFLPNLRHLSLWDWNRKMQSPVDYEFARQLLGVRPLESFRLCLDQPPPAAVAESLRSLGEERGIDVKLGVDGSQGGLSVAEFLRRMKEQGVL
ncbi:hypothetical protein R3P38DRAFT_3152153 [Favolaschia claudopus]|uniref:F-box domain-containing protein n=1 Tax=Favolaschia claudopus TaxID=2862362 RepID=A0AAV9Z0L0_9AGAR